MVLITVVTKVMPSGIISRISLLALALAVTASHARAEFLTCRESASGSEYRKTVSAGLLKFLEPAGDSTFHLTILQSDQPNAYAMKGSEIVVTTALLDTVRSSDEEAFVLGHEIGHLRSIGHAPAASLVSEATVNEERVAEEEEADRYAANLLNQKGMDSSAGVHLLARLQSIIPSPSLPRRKAALSGWIESRPHG